MTLATDLILAFILITIASVGLFIVGIRVGGRARWLTSALINCLAVAVLAAYALGLTDNPVLTHFLPVANVLLWGNLQLPAAALLGGIAWSSLKSAIWQRILLVVSLVAIGLWREAGPLIGHRPPIGAARWTEGVCRQTSTSSCSAAAATTLLDLYGIESSESEMIDNCLTHVEGTTTLGLYRGLMLKTNGTQWTVWAGTPAKEKIADWPLPAVVTVSLSGLPANLLGVGVGHSVVVESMDRHGRFVIDDPFVGRQIWTQRQLEDAYGGDLMAIVPRNEIAPH